MSVFRDLREGRYRRRRYREGAKRHPRVDIDSAAWLACLPGPCESLHEPRPCGIHRLAGGDGDAG